MVCVLVLIWGCKGGSFINIGKVFKKLGSLKEWLVEVGMELERKRYVYLVKDFLEILIWEYILIFKSIICDVF